MLHRAILGSMERFLDILIENYAGRFPAWPRLIRGDIERVIMVGLVAHHLIRFAREAASGRHNASHYSMRLREAAVAAE